jgi:hypothetical protein
MPAAAASINMALASAVKLRRPAKIPQRLKPMCYGLSGRTEGLLYLVARKTELPNREILLTKTGNPLI